MRRILRDGHRSGSPRIIFMGFPARTACQTRCLSVVYRFVRSSVVPFSWNQRVERFVGGGVSKERFHLELYGGSML